MPITQSAKKALRQSVKRQASNKKAKRLMKEAVKTARALVAQNKQEEAQSYMPKLYKVLDKAAKKGIIKKNTASRLKARVTARVTKVTASKK